MDISRLMVPANSPSKGNSKFEIFIVKIFSRQQKANQILSAIIEKNQFFSLQENYNVRCYNVLQCITIFTHIPAYSGMFTLIKTQSNIFRNYSSIFRTLCNPSVF